MVLPVVLKLFGSDLFATLLFGWAAECATNCLLPNPEFACRWDVASTFLNITGAMLSGIASGAVRAHPSSPALRRTVSCFQGGFVGVWTSFAFMAEHSAELAYEQPRRFRRAVTYVVSSVACGLAGNYMGVFLGRGYLSAVVNRIATSQWLPKAMVAVVVGCVARAFLSLTSLPVFPRGFVSDPTNPEFAGIKEVQSSHRDWKELLAGLGYASLAIVSGDHIGGWPGYRDGTMVPWSTLRCNSFAVATVVSAFYLKEARPQLIRNVVFIKCVSSFTGALSAFGGVCDETISLILSRHRTAALLHVAANGAVALLASLLLLAHHSRFRRLERAASTISKLVRQRSARKQLAELRRLSSNKEFLIKAEEEEHDEGLEEE